MRRKVLKLRVKGNTLRLRVARSELAKLLAGNRVEEAIHFAPEPNAELRYALTVDPASDGTHVSYRPGDIMVTVSADQMRTWGEESQVGIYTTLDIGHTEPLEVAIEKDFACLDGNDADNYDTFANPLEGKTC
jgi:hypothetical protein